MLWLLFFPILSERGANNGFRTDPFVFAWPMRQAKLYVDGLCEHPLQSGLALSLRSISRFAENGSR